jgi:hypothetical protein
MWLDLLQFIDYVCIQHDTVQLDISQAGLEGYMYTRETAREDHEEERGPEQLCTGFSQKASHQEEREPEQLYTSFSQKTSHHSNSDGAQDRATHHLNAGGSTKELRRCAWAWDTAISRHAGVSRGCDWRKRSHDGRCCRCVGS